MTNNIIATRLDTKIPLVFNQIRPGATFMSIKGYTNNFGEVSDFNLIFHFNYMNAVKKSINIWAQMQNQRMSRQHKAVLQSLMESYSDTLKYGFNHRAYSAHAYSVVTDANYKVINGVKFHVRDGVLHLVGLKVNKKIIKPGNYFNCQTSELAVIKKELLSHTPLANYRQFKLTNGRFKSISVDSIKLTPKDLHH